MAKDGPKRRSPAKLSANDNAFAALQQVSGYKPSNEARRMDAGTGPASSVKDARDNAAAAEWAMHNYILGAKDQIAAQFGKSSNEFQGPGMKKKSEYKKAAKER